MTTWDDILKDREHGATRLLTDTLNVLEAMLVSGSPLPDRFPDLLIAAHPGMACFHALKDHIRTPLTLETLATIRERIRREEEAVVAAFRSKLPNHITTFAVLSHSAMVVKCISTLPVRDLVVTCALSWPAGEGRIMAQELAEAGVREIRLVSDGHFFSSIGEHQALVLGCDAWSDTRFINKSGSRAAVRLALNTGIPVFVTPGPLRRVSENAMDNLPLKTIPFPAPVPDHRSVHAACPLLEQVSRQGVQLLEP